MIQQPIFTITVQAADYLVKIAETVTRLEYGTRFNRDIKLHRQNRVRSIHSSLAIEGNALSLDEVTAVLYGRIVAGKQAEIKEVKNAFEAYDKIMLFDPYSIKDFLKAHKLMTDGLISESGSFRSDDVGVFDGNVIVHLGARPNFVPQLMKELFGWAKKSELHPALKSAIMHCGIETIHPFADGNGRMGRLWQTLLLAKWNAIFAWIPMESLVYEKRQDYYKALQIAQKTNDSSGFIEFTLFALYEAVKAQKILQPEHLSIQQSSDNEIADKFVENAPEFVEKFVDNDTQNTIIKLMIGQPTISAKKIAEIIGMSSRGVQKSIDTLKKRGLLERVGSAKGGHWIVKSNR